MAEQKTYVIMGATGNIGHIVTQELLKYRHVVKVLGRDSKKLNILKIQGAEVLSDIDIEDSHSLISAFKGADGIFTFIPPGYDKEDLNEYQIAVANAIKTALKKNKTQNVVNLSSIGADLSEETGPIKGLHYLEKLLNSLPKINIVHLRPSVFMQNLYRLLPVIKGTGAFTGAIRGDLPVSMISTTDIGLKAAEFLHRLNFKGQSIFEMGGPRPVTNLEVAEIIGKAINIPELKYTQIGYEEAKKGMIAGGMKSNTASLMIEMEHAFNEGLFQTNPKINLEHRGKISIESFAQDFAKAYKKLH
jgi:uncharacterized protein YbjT (DUF2867 family)